VYGNNVHILLVISILFWFLLTLLIYVIKKVLLMLCFLATMVYISPKKSFQTQISSVFVTIKIIYFVENFNDICFVFYRTCIDWSFMHEFLDLNKNHILWFF